jgi:hypothetical protein
VVQRATGLPDGPSGYNRRAHRRVQERVNADIERRILGPHAMIGQVDIFTEQQVDVGRLAYPCLAARVLQHTVDNAVGALAVLGDFLHILLQGCQQIGNIFKRLGIEESLLLGQVVMQLVQ